MKTKIIYLLSFLLYLSACSEDSMDAYVPEKHETSTDPIDVYFQQNFQDKYGCAIRWRWNDTYVDINYIVTPAKREVLIPTGEMLRRFWIEPFILESKESGEFIRKHFPPEIVCVGSELRNPDGTKTLGYADAGVRITLTELNFFDLNDSDWVIKQLHTIHHEFSHIIHQTYNMPEGFNKITQDNYTSQAWDDIYTFAQEELQAAGVPVTQQNIDSVAQNMAIEKGMLTPYGTSSEFEDFAEMVSIFLLTDGYEFEETFITPDPERPFLDKGKKYIKEKIDLIQEYYWINFRIKLSHLRDIILQRLEEINVK